MKKEIRRVKLECGYARCCPTVIVYDDGSATIEDDDVAAGSVGTIQLRPEVARRLAEILGEKK